MQPDALIAFLKARIDELEALARGAQDLTEEVPGSWHYDEQARPVPRIIGTSWESSLTDGVWNCDDPDDHCEELRCPSRCAGRHIALHDPARALREVEAKREIVRLHGPMSILPGHPMFNDAHLTREPMRLCRSCEPETMWRREQSWPCRTLLTLAAIDSDHPDYRQEWAPRP